MRFALLTKNRDSDEARSRHRQLRARQFEIVRNWAESGLMTFGGALIEDGAPVGSIAIVEMPDRAALDAWLAEHPYVVNQIWYDIKVWSVQPAPIFATP